MKIQTPHDKFFKETIGRVEVATDFLNNYLPASIMNTVDMKTLEPQKDSFIDKDLKEIFADMLFRVNISNEEGYIYFLFEHKSYTSKNISLQLLKYMIEIWESKIKNKTTDELPVIIPLVIYHGSDNWNISTTLGEMIKGYTNLPKDLQKYIPDYEYLLYDISRYTDEQIKGEIKLRIMLTVCRDIFIKDDKGLQETILRATEYLAELKDRQTGIEYFETMMRYIFSARADLTKEVADEIMSKIETTYPEGSEVVMTLAERFREEGVIKGLEKVVRKSIIKGLTTEDIMEITGLKKEAIEDIRKKMLYESKENVI